jgi:cell division protein YceG involved in septum cleavage
MLILGGVGGVFAGFCIIEIHSLMNVGNPSIIQRTFQIIRKPLVRDVKQEIAFTIETGDTIEKIAQRLEEEDILSKNIFLSYIREQKEPLEGYFFEGKYQQ